MMDTPENWEHKSGYRINNDGCAIKYEHTDEPYLAIVEGMLDESEGELQYYTVLFNTEGDKPWETVESHEFFSSDTDAKAHLIEIMAKYA